MQISSNLPRYNEFDPKVPVWYVTPDIPGAIHRFFDTSALSPTGRYLAVTQLPTVKREPIAGETARIWLIDLSDGRSTPVYETAAWDTQLGAQVQWGADDETLYFNDIDTKTWIVRGVRLDWKCKRAERMDGPIYMVSPDGRLAISPDLARTRIVQPGYGVVVPSSQTPVYDIEDDGFWITNLDTGESKLLVSIQEACHEIGDKRFCAR